MEIRKHIDSHSNSKNIVFNEFNRIKTDYELKNLLFKKIDAESVLKQWEFKAKSNYSSKFLQSYKTNMNNVRDEFISWISDNEDALIPIDQVPFF